MNNKEIDRLLYGENANTNDLENQTKTEVPEKFIKPAKVVQPENNSVSFTKWEMRRMIIVLLSVILTLWIIFNIINTK